MVRKEQLLLAILAAAILGFFIGRLTGPAYSLPGAQEATRTLGTTASPEAAPRDPGGVPRLNRHAMEHLEALRGLKRTPAARAEDAGTEGTAAAAD